MRSLLLAAATVLAFTANGASATPFTGTVSTIGATVGTGPWDMTFEIGFNLKSIVVIDATSPITFGDLTELTPVFQDIYFGGSEGSPHFEIRFADHPLFGALHIKMGTSPLFGGTGADIDPAYYTASASGINLIGKDDGRYLLDIYGGNAFGDYTEALALLGDWEISEIEFYLDGNGAYPHDQELLLCNINVNGTIFGGPCSTTDTAVDDVPTLPVMATGMGLGFLTLRRGRKQRSAASKGRAVA
jgi:hypothetical protein